MKCNSNVTQQNEAVSEEEMKTEIIHQIFTAAHQQYYVKNGEVVVLFGFQNNFLAFLIVLT